MLPGVTTGLTPLIELVAYFPRSARMEKADQLAGRDLESWGCRPMMLELRTVFSRAWHDGRSEEGHVDRLCQLASVVLSAIPLRPSGGFPMAHPSLKACFTAASRQSLESRSRIVRGRGWLVPSTLLICSLAATDPVQAQSGRQDFVKPKLVINGLGHTALCGRWLSARTGNTCSRGERTRSSTSGNFDRAIPGSPGPSVPRSIARQGGFMLWRSHLHWLGTGRTEWPWLVTELPCPLVTSGSTDYLH